MVGHTQQALFVTRGVGEEMRRGDLAEGSEGDAGTLQIGREGAMKIELTAFMQLHSGRGSKEFGERGDSKAGPPWIRRQFLLEIGEPIASEVTYRGTFDKGDHCTRDVVSVKEARYEAIQEHRQRSGAHWGHRTRQGARLRILSIRTVEDLMIAAIELFVRQVCVTLGDGDVAVAGQLLRHAEISSGGPQHRGHEIVT